MQFEKFVDNGRYARSGENCWLVRFSDAELEELWRPKNGAAEIIRRLGHLTGQAAFEQHIPINMVIVDTNGLTEGPLAGMFQTSQVNGFNKARLESKG